MNEPAPPHTMTQAELGAAVGKSRSAVNAWEQDRALPRHSIGALERVLGVDLTGEYTDTYKDRYGQLDFDPDDRDEATIASWTVFTVAERQQKIDELRAARRAARRTA